MTLADWIALAIFPLCWAGYATVTDRVPRIRRRSVIPAMDEHRRRWMLALLLRENRISGTAIIGNLMSSTGFLANTAICGAAPKQNPTQSRPRLIDGDRETWTPPITPCCA
ncbi:MAG: DUF599 family protein [Alphaproteobacteria bacterium]|nr:DUF599 family protein [Alphaproteobacteria bacterium]